MDSLIKPEPIPQQNEENGNFELTYRRVFPPAAKTSDYFIGFFCVLLWISLFSAGIIIPAKPYLEHLHEAFDWQDMILATVLYTYTNAAFLTCLAGAVGGVSSRMTLRSYYDVAGESSRDATTVNLESIAYRSESPFLSVYRSFAVYLLYMAGLSIGLSGAVDPNENFGLGVTTASQYMRIAGLLSSFGFIVGYDPTIFTALITRFSSTQPGRDFRSGAKKGPHSAD